MSGQNFRVFVFQRCDGKCCRAFSVGEQRTPENIYQDYLEGVAEGGVDPQVKWWVDNLIPIDSQPVGGIEGNPIWSTYTCAHHDPVTGNCKDYENRPPMCSDYPYGNQCGFPGCTFRGFSERRLLLPGKVEEQVA